MKTVRIKKCQGYCDRPIGSHSWDCINDDFTLDDFAQADAVVVPDQYRSAEGQFAFQVKFLVTHQEKVVELDKHEFFRYLRHLSKQEEYEILHN